MKIKKEMGILVLILLFFVMNLCFLESFPLMHSDESWLSGSTRSVVEAGTFGVKESFFDLYPRPVHLLRSVFTLLQWPFMVLFGYRLFSFRLLSLLAACFSLYFFYRKLQAEGKSINFSLAGTLLLAGSIQFLYASHMARHDILVIMAMLLGLSLLEHRHAAWYLGIITVIMMGVTPNSFLLGVLFLTLILDQILQKKRSWKEGRNYVAVLFLGALLIVLGSLWLNPSMISDYLDYAKTQGVVGNPVGRLQGMVYYYQKLWLRIGGSYRLMDLRWDLVLLSLSLLWGMIHLLRNKSGFHRESLIVLLSLQLAYTLMGRYNQLAIVFFLVPGLLLLLQLLWEFDQKKAGLMLLPLLLLQWGYSAWRIQEEPRESYQKFVQQVLEALPGEGKVLGNLNLEYGLQDRLLDVRNLDELRKRGMSFSDYIKKNEIEYLVLYEEMEYIHQNIKRWHILYGDLAWYEEMMDFLRHHGRQVAQMESACYGMRIGRYLGDYPWWVKIYQLQ